MLQIGDLSIDAYFRKIESLTTALAKLGYPMTNDDVVTFAINGLGEKYEQVARIIAHLEPFPDLNKVLSMVTTEEMRLKSKTQEKSRHSSE